MPVLTLPLCPGVVLVVVCYACALFLLHPSVVLASSSVCFVLVVILLWVGLLQHVCAGPPVINDNVNIKGVPLPP